MTTKNAEAMFDAGVRIEATLWIPGSVADVEATPDVFRDFCDSLEVEDDRLLEKLPALKRFAIEDNYSDPEEVASALIYVEGFLIQAATPVRKYHDENAASLSWGSYYTAWLYAPTEADIAPTCIAWAHSMHEADKKKSGFGKAATETAGATP